MNELHLKDVRCSILTLLPIMRRDGTLYSTIANMGVHFQDGRDVRYSGTGQGQPVMWRH